jgi:hypothetical protein
MRVVAEEVRMDENGDRAASRTSGNCITLLATRHTILTHYGNPIRHSLRSPQEGGGEEVFAEAVEDEDGERVEEEVGLEEGGEEEPLIDEEGEGREDGDEREGEKYDF